MTVSPRTRVALGVVGIAVAVGSLTGCARGALSSQPAPAGVTANTVSPTPSTAPVPTSAPSSVSVQDIQNDLNSADFATSNADGDVADADSSAATSDSP